MFGTPERIYEPLWKHTRNTKRVDIHPLFWYNLRIDKLRNRSLAADCITAVKGGKNA